VNLSGTRQAITTALSGTSANLYWYVPETVIAPAIVIVPDSDYIEPISISRNQYKARFRVTFLVSMRNNQSALDNIESLAFDTLAALPNGWQVGNVSQPNPINLGQADLLSADLTVEVMTTAE
jgi:hypothetical protein